MAGLRVAGTGAGTEMGSGAGAGEEEEEGGETDTAAMDTAWNREK